MLKNAVSICMISLGVVVGVFRTLFMILSTIIYMCFISFLVVVHVSVAHSSVGIRHVSMSFHIYFHFNFAEVIISCYIENCLDCRFGFFCLLIY